MRELVVHLRFDKHCLGQVRFRWKRGKRQMYYLLPRNADGSREEDHRAAIACAALRLIPYEKKIARKALAAELD